MQIKSINLYSEYSINLQQLDCLLVAIVDDKEYRYSFIQQQYDGHILPWLLTDTINTKLNELIKDINNA